MYACAPFFAARLRMSCPYPSLASVLSRRHGLSSLHAPLMCLYGSVGQVYSGTCYEYECDVTLYRFLPRARSLQSGAVAGQAPSPNRQTKRKQKAQKSATTPCLPASPPRVHNHRHSTRSSRLINIRTIRIRSFFICKLFGDK